MRRKKDYAINEETSLEENKIQEFKVILIAENYIVVDLGKRGNYRIQRKKDGSLKPGDFIPVELE